jgi:hypothetical protein
MAPRPRGDRVATRRRVDLDNEDSEELKGYDLNIHEQDDENKREHRSDVGSTMNLRETCLPRFRCRHDR